MTNGRLSPQLIPSDPHELTLEEDPVVIAFYDVLIDDFSNSSMFFSFSPDDLEVTTPFSSSQTEMETTSSSYIDPDSDLSGEFSTDTPNTTDTSSSGGHTVGEDEDYYYDSDF
ncbi:hypothetical protein LOD99_5092 [Oopsacas minuta]|uniref:Uncharacterized protein n=1 Tax=Oopsacas minuta TaxID=111878 RepID=A0AAV7JSH4_9METZ|nr:hypothetical protein LOD99_5092 [Oopsacas minuta]